MTSVCDLLRAYCAERSNRSRDANCLIVHEAADFILDNAQNPDLQNCARVAKAVCMNADGSENFRRASRKFYPLED